MTTQFNQNTMKKKILGKVILSLFVLYSYAQPQLPEPGSSPIKLGDPYILNDGGTYYLYGTWGDEGIEVYKSTDLKNWKGPCGVTNGMAMHKNDIGWKDSTYCPAWAPEVYKIKDRYYMFVSIDKRIAVTTSESPMGPFKQKRGKVYKTPNFAIDHHLCLLGEQPMVFFVSFEPRGLEVWSAELDDKLMSIRECTFSRCVYHFQDWEYEIVNEAPFILKDGEFFYLVYSGNGHESHDYGLGFAVSKSLSGPWIKHPENPFLQRPGDLVGVGHCAFFNDQEGQLKIVYHSHFNQESTHPRKVYINDVHFVKDEKYKYRVPKVDISELNPLLHVK
jgi:beta-xylosidase